MAGFATTEGAASDVHNCLIVNQGVKENSVSSAATSFLRVCSYVTSIALPCTFGSIVLPVFYVVLYALLGDWANDHKKGRV